MSRLPKVGSDDGVWGQLLNDYLLSEHAPDGSLKIRSDGTLDALQDVANKVDVNDPRLNDTRTPKSHAASHAPGGTDPITLSALNAAPASELFFSTYNAANDGVTDVTTLFSTALTDAHTAGKVLYIDKPGTYAMSNITKSFAPKIIAAPGVTIRSLATSGWLWNFTGSAGTPVSLTADMAQSTATFSASTTTLAAGDLIRIGNQRAAWSGYPTDWQGMLAEIDTVDTVASATIKSRAYTAFTVADTATVTKITPIEDVVIRGVEFLNTNATSTCGFIRLIYARNVDLDFTGRGAGAAGVRLEHCYSVRVRTRAIDYYDKAITGLQQFGYGVEAVGATTLGYFEIVASRVRHAFTSGGIAGEAGEPGNLSVTGVAEGCTSAGWDAHAPGYEIAFNNCQAIGCRSYGISVRCKRGHVNGGLIDGCMGGIWLFDNWGGNRIRNVAISNTRVLGDTSGTPGQGINVTSDGSDLVIANCDIRDTYRNAIRFGANVSDVRIVDNRFHNWGTGDVSGERAGVRMINDAVNIKVHNNTVTDNLAIGTINRPFIYGTVSGSGNLVQNNFLYNSIPLIQTSAAPFWTSGMNIYADSMDYARFKSSTAAEFLSTRLNGDVNNRISMQTDGKIQWGNGTATPDTTISRVQAGVLGMTATELRSIPNAATDAIMRCNVTSEAQSRMKISGSGQIDWGDGTNAIDTTLRRSSANVLKTDDRFEATDSITIKAKAGAPTDADFASTPTNGTLAVDTTNNRLYIRIGGLWKSVIVA